MKVSDRTWDVRCPEKLGKLFPKRTGYYFRVDHVTAQKVLNILSRVYHIPTPALGRLPKEEPEHAQYDYETGTVFLRPRNHLKTIFHEFYHHLDNMTGGIYYSDDRQGGTSSLAWLFAELLWKEFSSDQKEDRKEVQHEETKETRPHRRRNRCRRD